MVDAPFKILFVGGVGRSGSSILERYLDFRGPFRSFGEIHQLFSWNIAFSERMSCSCGAPIRACPFWTGVVEDVFGAFDRFDPRELEALRRRAVSWRKLVAVAYGRARPDADLVAFGDLLRRLYASLHARSGATVLVDSSKPALYCLALLVAGLPLAAVHLTRDPRAVAFSWQRRKRRVEVTWREEYMPVFPAPLVAVRWLRGNLLFAAVKRRTSGHMHLRYEDFVRAPDAARSAIERLVGAAAAAPRPTDAVGHSLMGNPSRLGGDLRIAEDTEWRERCSVVQRGIVTAISLPGMVAWGYVK